MIIPTFNRPEELRRAVAGVANQSYRDVEIIVVDDNSDVGDVQAVLSEFSVVQSTFIGLRCSNPDGSGPAFVRNQGAVAASGALLAFCDDDDVWTDPSHLAVAVACFKARSELELYFSDQRAMASDGSQAQCYRHPQLRKLVTSRTPVRADCYPVTAAEVLQTDYFPHLNTTVMARSMFDRLGGFWEMARYSEDQDLLVRACDTAALIIFRPVVTATHHQPDQTEGNNASTRILQRHRWLAYAAIGDHIRLTCQSEVAHEYADRLQGNAYKHLTEVLFHDNQLRAARRFSRLAGSILPTLKWWLFDMYLRARARLT